VPWTMGLVVVIHTQSAYVMEGSRERRYEITYVFRLAEGESNVESSGTNHVGLLITYTSLSKLCAPTTYYDELMLNCR
jgi:hypothetical protein